MKRKKGKLKTYVSVNKYFYENFPKKLNWIVYRKLNIKTMLLYYCLQIVKLKRLLKKKYLNYWMSYINDRIKLINYEKEKEIGAFYIYDVLLAEKKKIGLAKEELEPDFDPLIVDAVGIYLAKLANRTSNKFATLDTNLQLLYCVDCFKILEFYDYVFFFNNSISSFNDTNSYYVQKAKCPCKNTYICFLNEFKYRKINYFGYNLYFTSFNFLNWDEFIFKRIRKMKYDKMYLLGLKENDPNILIAFDDHDLQRYFYYNYNKNYFIMQLKKKLAMDLFIVGIYDFNINEYNILYDKNYKFIKFYNEDLYDDIYKKKASLKKIYLRGYFKLEIINEKYLELSSITNLKREYKNILNYRNMLVRHRSEKKKNRDIKKIKNR